MLKTPSPPLSRLASLTDVPRRSALSARSSKAATSRANGQGDAGAGASRLPRGSGAGDYVRRPRGRGASPSPKQVRWQVPGDEGSAAASGSAAPATALRRLTRALCYRERFASGGVGRSMSNDGTSVSEPSKPAANRLVQLVVVARAALLLALVFAAAGRVLPIPGRWLEGSRHAGPSLSRLDAAASLAARTFNDFSLSRFGWSCEASLDAAAALRWRRGSAPWEQADASGELFSWLTSWTCAWDGGHLLWLGEVGYGPPEATDIAFGGRRGEAIGMSLACAQGGVVVDRLTLSRHGEALPAMASGAIREGDRLLSAAGVAVNGSAVPCSGEIMATQARIGDAQRPVVVRVQPPGARSAAHAAFHPLFPRLVVRPVRVLADAAAWLLRRPVPPLRELRMQPVLNATALAEHVGEDQGRLWGGGNVPPGASIFRVLLLCVVTALGALGVLVAAAARRAVLQSSVGVGGLWVHPAEEWLLVFPTAFVLAAPYTESLYLPLYAGWLWALAASRPTAAALLGLLLPLCRGTGAFCAVPALLWAWPRLSSSASGAKHDRSRALTVVAAPIAGYAVYLVWMKWLTGDAFAGVAAQGYFPSQFSAANMLDPRVMLRELVSARSEAGGAMALHGTTNSLLDRTVFGCVVVALCAVTFGSRDAPWARWARGGGSLAHRVVAASCTAVGNDLPVWVLAAVAVHALVPPLSGSFMSYSRYALVAAWPLLWCVSFGGAACAADVWRSLWRGFIALCALLQYVTVVRFITSDAGLWVV